VGNEISDNIYSPETFFLESDTGGFDADGTFTLTWTVSQNADNYTLYQNGGILTEGLNVTEYNIVDLSAGTYEFYVKAFNINGEVDSNTIKVIVKFLLYIDGNLDFHQNAIENNFTGDGSLNDPYVIENYEIYATIGHGVHIKNTNLHFIIRDITVNDGKLNNYYGFYLENVTHGMLEDNIASNNQYGFYLKNSFNNTLITNTAIGNTNGFTLNCSYINILTANIITDNRHGFSLESSYNNTISGNEVIDNTYLGFYLSSSYNNTLTENLATGNLNGFTLSYSDLNTFTNNTANNNDQHGFRLLYSHYNNLIENSACYNLKYGIYLEDSTFNVISGNILENNGIGPIYEKFTDDTDYLDVFLIATIIFIIALLSIILIKLVFFIKRKNIKFSIPKLSLKKRKE
jgi:parallel beta-helix repeat protein